MNIRMLGLHSILFSDGIPRANSAAERLLSTVWDILWVTTQWNIPPRFVVLIQAGDFNMLFKWLNSCYCFKMERLWIIYPKFPPMYLLVFQRTLDSVCLTHNLSHILEAASSKSCVCRPIASQRCDEACPVLSSFTNVANISCFVKDLTGGIFTTQRIPRVIV